MMINIIYMMTKVIYIRQTTIYDYKHHTNYKYKINKILYSVYHELLLIVLIINVDEKKNDATLIADAINNKNTSRVIFG